MPELSHRPQSRPRSKESWRRRRWPRPTAPPALDRPTSRPHHPVRSQSRWGSSDGSPAARPPICALTATQANSTEPTTSRPKPRATRRGGQDRGGMIRGHGDPGWRPRARSSLLHIPRFCARHGKEDTSRLTRTGGARPRHRSRTFVARTRWIRVDGLGIIDDAAVVIDRGRVSWLGPTDAVPAADRRWTARVCRSLLVDPHPMPWLARRRVRSAPRQRAADILEAARHRPTVAATREADAAQLRAHARPGRSHALRGVTTVEVRAAAG